MAGVNSSFDSLPRDFPGGRLRRLRTTDLAAFQGYRQIPDLGRYQGWSVMTDAEATAFLAEMSAAPIFTPGEWLQLGIAEPESDVLIGDIGIHVSADGFTGEIGFTLQPSAQGHGIATAAVHAALQIVFAATPVQRVLGITDSRNSASARLLERTGFKLQESRGAMFRGESCIEQVYVLARGRH